MNHSEGALETRLKKSRLTLSVAESMTGGRLAHLLTLRPGASEYFLGGVVAYSNSSKERLLGVNPEILKTHGAVSEAVALEMAQGALLAFDSDYALSITGVAGPSGGSVEKPVGCAWCAIASKTGLLKAWRFQAKGKERAAIIEEGALELYKGLLDEL